MRSSWDQYFMDIAHKVATRATCPRGSVGAVFVKDHGILSTGYNGSVSGTEHCVEFPEEIHVVNNHCDIVLHAEINAIIWAAKKGIALDGSTLYCTHVPCWPCAKAVLGLNVQRIVYTKAYNPDPRIVDYCIKKNVILNHLINRSTHATSNQDP